MYQAVETKLMTVKEASSTILRDPEEVTKVCKDLAHLAQESFQVLTINAKNRLIDRHMITLGVADACLVHPREVFRACVEDSAVAFIMVHNHPSGDTNPSAEDLRITRQLIEAGKIMDIKAVDHVIIGRENGEAKGFSLREEGLCAF